MTDCFVTEDFPRNQTEFDQRFSDEQACYEYLFQQRWPKGFVCPRCGHCAYWKSARDLCICCRCEHNQSVTAGTIMHSTKKPLTAWFKAMWWFTTRKSGVNAMTLKDLLGLGSYNTTIRPGDGCKNFGVVRSAWAEKNSVESLKPTNFILAVREAGSAEGVQPLSVR